MSRQNTDFVNLTYKDLKRECVIRGMPFEDVVNGDFFRLQNWLYNNAHLEKDYSLINKYDDWVEEELRALGATDLIHDSLRLSYIGDKAKVEKQKRPVKEKKVKKPKKKRELNEFGVVKGTKKALTYEFQAKGYSLKKTIRKIKKKFPEASEKSITIWYKKAQRLNK